MATLEQLEAALRAADAAGNVEDARRLAQAYAAARGQQPQADFRNVQAQADTVAPVTIGGEDAATMPAWKNAAYGLVSPIADTIVGVGQMTGLMDEDTAQQSLQRIDAVRGRAPGAVAGVVGDVGMMALPLSRVGALSKAGRLATSGATGAAYAGSRGVHEGESRLTNTAIGGALGVAGQVGADKLAAAGQRAAKAISPEVRQLYEAAKARGITLTPAQLSDSKALKFLQSSLSRLPFSGTQGKLAAQKAAWNRELAKEIGVDAPAVTPQVYADKKFVDSVRFEELTARNNLKVDDGLISKLEAIRKEALMAGGDVASTASSVIDDFYQRAVTGKGGIAVPGQAYQAFDSQLGQIAMKGTPTAHFVGKVKAAVREAMDNSIAPADREAWAKLRREYGNRKTIRDLVAKSEGGELSPAALMGRVTANNAGKESMASGTRGGLGELARIGQRIKEPQSSGTVERLAPYLLGAGTVVNAPITLASLFGGRAVQQVIDSPALARLMLREGRGKTQKGLAKLLPPGAIGAAPVVADTKRAKDSRKRP